MKLFYSLMLCSFSFLHSVSFAKYDIKFKQKNTLSVCSYSEFTPVIYANGQGYEADLLKAVAKILNVEIKFYPENNYEGLWRLPSKSYAVCDISAGGFSPLEYRIKENTHFSVISTYFSQSLLVLKKDYESGKIKDYSSFKNTNMKIGYVPATSGEIFAKIQAKENDLKSANTVSYPGESELLEALLTGEIHALARGEIGNEYQSYLNPELVTIAKRNFGEGFSFAVDPNNPLLEKTLNKLITNLTKNVSYSDWLRDKNIFLKASQTL